MDELNIAQEWLDLGTIGFLSGCLLLLWRAYQQRVAEHIEDLRDMAGLRAQLKPQLPTASKA